MSVRRPEVMAFAVDPGDVLLSFAEIAVAFAGFASVVAIFQQRSDSNGGVFDVFRFWVMLEFSLAALFFSLLPLLLGFIGLPSTLVWSLSGGTLIVFILAHGVFTATLIRRRHPRVVPSLTRGLSVIANTAFSAIILSQALNLVGVFDRTFAPYLAGLLLVLFGAALNFVRLVWVGNPSLTE